MKHRHWKVHAGERAISASATSTQTSLRKSALWRMATPREGASTVRESQAGFEPAFPLTRSIRYLHHQRRLSRASHCAANQKNCLRRLPRRDLANSEESALPSVSGSSPRSLRQAPRAWARALPREPRDPGLPFRPQAGQTSFGERALPSGNKKPSGASGSGGFASRSEL
jgi:hypothetical protein